MHRGARTAVPAAIVNAAACWSAKPDRLLAVEFGETTPRRARRELNRTHESVMASTPSPPTILPKGEGSLLLPARAGRFADGAGKFAFLLSSSAILLAPVLH